MGNMQAMIHASSAHAIANHASRQLLRAVSVSDGLPAIVLHHITSTFMCRQRLRRDLKCCV